MTIAISVLHVSHVVQSVLTRRRRGVRLQPLIEPVEYGLEPKLAVLRLQNPVSLVRVVEQLRRDALRCKVEKSCRPSPTGTR